MKKNAVNNPESKVPQKVKNMLNKLNKMPHVEAGLGFFNEEYFSIYMNFKYEEHPTKENITEAFDVLRSIGRESYKRQKLTFAGVYAELYW